MIVAMLLTFASPADAAGPEDCRPAFYIGDPAAWRVPTDEDRAALARVHGVEGTSIVARIQADTAFLYGKFPAAGARGVRLATMDTDCTGFAVLILESWTDGSYTVQGLEIGRRVPLGVARTDRCKHEPSQPGFDICGPPDSAWLRRLSQGRHTRPRADAKHAKDEQVTVLDLSSGGLLSEEVEVYWTNVFDQSDFADFTVDGRRIDAGYTQFTFPSVYPPLTSP